MRHQRTPQTAQEPAVSDELARVAQLGGRSAIDLAQHELLRHRRHRTPHELKVDSLWSRECHGLDRHDDERSDLRAMRRQDAVAIALEYLDLFAKLARCTPGLV